MGSLLNHRQVMNKYGITYNQLYYAIYKGKIPAKKWGWMWVFNEDDLPSEWPKSNVGRPSKNK